MKLGLCSLAGEVRGRGLEAATRTFKMFNHLEKAVNYFKYPETGSAIYLGIYFDMIRYLSRPVHNTSEIYLEIQPS